MVAGLSAVISSPSFCAVDGWAREHLEMCIPAVPFL